MDMPRTKYDMIVDCKTVKRNLMDLIDLGYEIEFSESVRMVPRIHRQRVAVADW